MKSGIQGSRVLLVLLLAPLAFCRTNQESQSRVEVRDGITTVFNDAKQVFRPLDFRIDLLVGFMLSAPTRRDTSAFSG